MMSSLSCSLSACICNIIGLLFLLHSFFASRWISACVSLASVVLDQKNVDSRAGSLSHPHPKSESAKFQPLGTGSLVMDQQLLNENVHFIRSFSSDTYQEGSSEWRAQKRLLLDKCQTKSFEGNEHSTQSNSQLLYHQPALQKSWLFENLNSKIVCFSKGFFGYCMFGEGLLRFGNYHICVDNEVGEISWNTAESHTVSALMWCASLSVFSIFFLVVAVRLQWCRSHVKAVSVMRYVAAAFTFVSGTVILVGLFPIAAQSISYSSNPTNFYNDMVSRIGASYLFEMKVNWAAKDGDLTVAQAWARNIVRNFSGLGLDRDFFIALAAGILLYTACASLLLSIRSSFLEQTEKYSSSFFTNQKQS